MSIKIFFFCNRNEFRTIYTFFNQIKNINKTCLRDFKNKLKSKILCTRVCQNRILVRSFNGRFIAIFSSIRHFGFLVWGNGGARGLKMAKTVKVP